MAVQSSPAEDDKPTLDEARLVMGKWIETQQIISKERNDWQQGKEILTGRVKIVGDEIAVLEQKIATAKASVKETDAKQAELTADADRLKAATADLASKVSAMEAEVRRLLVAMPDPVKKRLQPLADRIPSDPAATKVTAAERFQNVLGILNEINKANSDIAINYEVHELANGKSAEVQAIYIGLAQAYFVSAAGDAGIGRPSLEGWTWEPSTAISNDILKALEIMQGKHTPAFVPVPVTIQ
ncbi:MAG: DUF3450 family protein [Phycisphaerae bacterium]|jgi:transposase-like protein|nr:DUF3450 family protein [Phycisphaerae bacterium]